MAGYSREFLIDAFMSRYISCSSISIEDLEHQEQLAVKLYDRVGRDKFREYASLSAERIKEYKATLGK